jgi:hypothetical protein
MSRRYRRSPERYEAVRHLSSKGALSVSGGHPISIDLGAGRTDLHTVSYREILAGRGWKATDALPAIMLVERLLGRGSDGKEM